jgi:anti-sigma regulatory factor (Ser/Thr protein kinase)
MNEFWYFSEDHELEAKKLLQNLPKPVISNRYDINERDFVHSGNASSQIKLALKKLGVDYDTLRRVAISAYEAEINVTAHSKGGFLIANIHTEFVHLVFEDFGPGIPDIEQCMVAGYSTADDLVREMGFGAGLGLPNIKKNCDVLHIQSEYGKNTSLEILIFYG